MVLEDWRSIDESAFDRLKNDFTSEEIVELVAWISFMIAAQMFGAISKRHPPLRTNSLHTTRGGSKAWRLSQGERNNGMYPIATRRAAFLT